MTGLRRWRASALLAVLVAVLALLVVPPGPARAECSVANPQDCLPGGGSGGPVDCKEAPAAAAPDTGMAGWFVRAPEEPPSGDPFADDPVVSTYDVYGYAGLEFSTYDLGCGPGAIRNPKAEASDVIANLLYTPALWLVALDNSVREYAYQPDSMWGWTNDLIQRASDALRDRIFSAWGGLALAAVGVWLLWGSRRGNFSDAVATAGWAVLVMVLVTAVAAWPLKASTVADASLTGALGQISAGLSSQDPGDDRDPARRASGVLTDTVLYEQWLRGTLGSADSETAQKYGPDLYRARALSWQEAAAVRSDPAQRRRIIAAKAKLWVDTAAAVQREDPDAYQYLTGKKGPERVGAALIALLAAFAVTPFDLVASLLILIAFLIVRLAVAFLPILGTIGLLRPTSGPLRGLLRTVVAALINCVVFGAGSAVFLLATDLITGTRSLAGWQQVFLIWVVGLVLWLLLRPYRRLTQLAGKDPIAELTGGFGSMQRRLLGDLRQLAIGSAGTYLGGTAALEADEERRMAAAGGAAGARQDRRPESWSRAAPGERRVPAGAYGSGAYGSGAYGDGTAPGPTGGGRGVPALGGGVPGGGVPGGGVPGGGVPGGTVPGGAGEWGGRTRGRPRSGPDGPGVDGRGTTGPGGGDADRDGAWAGAGESAGRHPARLPAAAAAVVVGARLTEEGTGSERVYRPGGPSSPGYDRLSYAEPEVLGGEEVYVLYRPDSGFRTTAADLGQEIRAELRVHAETIRPVGAQLDGAARSVGQAAETVRTATSSQDAAARATAEHGRR